MGRRVWTRLAMLLSGGAVLLEMGCRASLIRELDLLSSPEAISALFTLPRSNLGQMFRLLWY